MSNLFSNLKHKINGSLPLIVKNWHAFETASKYYIDQNEKLFRYNQVTFKASHNSEERAELFPDEHLEQGLCRSLELDFVVLESSVKEPQWVFKVQHNDSVDPNAPNMEAELLKLKSWCKKNPSHTVLTVHFDMKTTAAIYGEDSDFNTHFDALISRVFDRQNIFTPDDFRGTYTTLLEAAQKRGWPYLSELNGKIIFVFTGSDGHAAVRRRRDNYERGLGRLCFVDIDTRIGHCDPHSSNTTKLNPLDINNAFYKSYPNRVFLNLHLTAKWYWQQLVRDAHDLGYVIRGWKVNDRDTWAQAMRTGVNLIATDCVCGMGSSFANPSSLGFHPLGQYLESDPYLTNSEKSNSINIASNNNSYNTNNTNASWSPRSSSEGAIIHSPAKNSHAALMTTTYAESQPCPPKEHHFVAWFELKVLFCRRCGFSKAVQSQHFPEEEPLKLARDNPPLLSNPSPVAITTAHGTYWTASWTEIHSRAKVVDQNCLFVVTPQANFPSLVTVQSAATGAFVVPDPSGVLRLQKRGSEEPLLVTDTWTLEFDSQTNTCTFFSCFDNYLSSEKSGNLVANRTVRKNWERFKFVEPFK